jgi:phage baseplate assembly protein W
MTRFDERVMRPNFGTNAQNAAFENQTDAADLVREAVFGCFTAWFPYLTIVNVSADFNDNVLECIIFYNKTGEGITERVNIKTQLLTRAGELIREIR